MVERYELPKQIRVGSLKTHPALIHAVKIKAETLVQMGRYGNFYFLVLAYNLTLDNGGISQSIPVTATGGFDVLT